MSQSRGLGLVTVRHIEGAADVARRATAYIEANLPGTLFWELFVDRESGRGLMYQLHASEEAEQSYEQAMVGQGFQAELGEHAELDEIIVLSPVTSQARAELDHFGGIAMDRLAGVSR